MGAAMLAAGLTLWVTFTPCFLWIFLGAPYLEQITAQPRLAGALRGITAAVVGVVLNLSLWFALHVIFTQVDQVRAGPLSLWVPCLVTIDGQVLLLTAVSALLLLVLRRGVLEVLICAGLLAVALSLVI